MRYEGSVYRPPSEARSLIIQVTIGCAHNECTFCGMYKDKVFRVRSEEDVFEDLRQARGIYKDVKRIFLGDGNALALKTERLTRILDHIQVLFPECQRVSLYAAPKDILRRSEEELLKLKSKGLGILYMGIESGSDQVLVAINKGVSSEEIIKAGQKAIRLGLVLSTMIISGLGGVDLWREHALESARVLSAINPQYISLLTLMIEPQTPLYTSVERGEFQLLSPHLVLEETRLFIEKLNVTHCQFRSNHASNYIALKGQLPHDRGALLLTLEKALLKSEAEYNGFYRRL